MNNFLEKTSVQGNLDKIQHAIQEILKHTQWPTVTKDLTELTSISINLKRSSSTKIENKWIGGSGRLIEYKNANQLFKTVDGVKKTTQDAFTIWNEEVPDYLKKLVYALEKAYNFKSGRVRISRLPPLVSLNLHFDNEERFHLAVKTNPSVFFYNQFSDQNNPKNYKYQQQIDRQWPFHQKSQYLPYKPYSFRSYTKLNLYW
jgi:hypothetical protein